jgi:hypothetical protein
LEALLKKYTNLSTFSGCIPPLYGPKTTKKNYSKFNFLQKPHTYGQKKLIKYKLDIKPHNVIDKKKDKNYLK